MDTNKMRDISREQFEAWYLEKHCGGIDRVKTCSNAPGTYYYTDTQTKWVAWQASREAVVVELPNRAAEAYREEFDDLEGGSFNEAAYIRDVRKVIEAVGLKVAP